MYVNIDIGYELQFAPADTLLTLLDNFVSGLILGIIHGARTLRDRETRAGVEGSSIGTKTTVNARISVTSTRPSES